MTGVVLGRDAAGELEPALRREWLVANGLGGYASGTVAGVATRRYHGLLVAALTPPVDRTVLIGGLVEWLTVDGERVALHAHEYADGTIDQHGYRRLESFRLDGALPVWRYAVGDTAIEKRVWMEHGANTTYVRYEVVRGSRAVDLEVVPLVTRRDHHALTGEWAGIPTGEPGLRVIAGGGTETALGSWFRGFRHREEEARGLDARSDLYAPCAYRATIPPGESWTLTLTSEANGPTDPEAALAAALVRQATLLERASAADAPPPIRQLVLAADQFIVDRPIPATDGSAEPGRTIVAGYPWFNDWGRDTMIALPGLTLSTGRPEEAETILRAFARFVRDGLLPNNFPDRAGDDPGYNTVDASLWYPLAVRAHADATGSRELVSELLPTLRAILDHHIAGTRYGIAVDPSDGLLRAGEPGVQLTWMDARVGDRVITPRIGKPVEIQALWINALRTVGGWLVDAAEADAGHAFISLADRGTASFRARFWDPGRGHLADVVDGPDGDDWSLRPNQLLALSLPHPLVDGPVAEAVLDAVGHALVTSFGLRSLAPSDPAYRARFQGPPPERDGAYHQGTVWSWLLGPWVDAVLRVTGNRELARSYLEPMAHHLADAGLGSVSECFEPEPPHEPRACIAQAWGVAEILRAWRAVEGLPAVAPPA
ncbi:MAG TPA: amylo-alpha-1,6-glucosidase [Candidatus Limnocylindrales bacterium]|nr:amylo-alpha-1,6-glucosidase [Candidatus Limnocylindrales bacterium]